MSARDTIFALASGRDPAGVAVIRVSGSRAAEVFPALTGQPPPLSRQTSLRRLTDPGQAEVIDRALTLWFPAPASFTGENVAELHVHGGPAVVASVLTALATISEFRPAEAGEFSRRAFRNGKLDLAEAEGLADLIAADTAAARRLALWQMEGGLSALYRDWRHALIEVAALLETELDFADEVDSEALATEARRKIVGLAEELERRLASERTSERLRDGLRVVLTGAVNVGKSSLLNALVKREAAIVTDIPGTTRDVVDVRLDIGGYPVRLSDTAGLRETNDPIEREGVRRARLAAETADLIIDVRDLTRPDLSTEPSCEPGQPRCIFWNKADSAPAQPQTGIAGSARTGEGLEALTMRIEEQAAIAYGSDAPPAITRIRHRVAVSEAHAALLRALSAPAVELMAEDIRLAQQTLGRVVGVVDVEDVLDQIFMSFCIGK